MSQLLSPATMSLTELCPSLSACRRCADAGYFIGSTPISTLNAGAIFMTVGQAPGRHEAEVTHLPFSGPAGRRLFRWLAQAGFDEAEFRATQAMVAITRCYPGPHPAGRGDRVPTRAEQALCAPWLEAELALIRPRVLIPIGGLAIGKFLGNDSTMTDLIGRAVRAGRRRWLRQRYHRAAAASVGGQPMVQRAGEQGAAGAGAGDFWWSCASSYGKAERTSGSYSVFRILRVNGIRNTQYAPRNPHTSRIGATHGHPTQTR